MDATLNENIPNALDFIMASTTKMDSLLSGLLDVCRLNTATTDLKQMDMDTIISNITASVEYQIKESAAKIDIEALPPCVGDPLQINRVFTNLLTNALKFLDRSRPGEIDTTSNKSTPKKSLLSTLQEKRKTGKNRLIDQRAVIEKSSSKFLAK